MRFGYREYQIGLILVACVFAMPILMYFINGMNNRMLADDYCFAANVQQFGWAGAMQHYYYNWQGTFSSTGVQSAIALTNGLFTPLLPLALILGWWVSLSLFVMQLGQLIGFKYPLISSITLATVVLYVVLEGAPTVFQSIYWTSGSVTYALPMVLFTFLGAAVLYIGKRITSFLHAISYGVLISIFASILAGFSPIFAVFAIGCMGICMLAVWFLNMPYRNPDLLFLSLILIGFLIGTLIMVLAPGNSVRQGMYQKPDGMLALLAINLASTASFLAIDLSAFSLIPNIVLLVIGGWLVSSGVEPQLPLVKYIKRYPKSCLTLTFLVALVLLFGIFLPTSYNISGFPPGRALIIPHVVIVSLILFWGVVMAVSLRPKTHENQVVSKTAVVCFIFLMAIGPIATTWKLVNLAPKFQTFAAEWDARDQQIREAQHVGEKQVRVQHFTVDLADYVNVGSAEDEFVACLQAYYQIQELVVEG